MKKSDHCEEICVKALISKNNSTRKNAVSQALYGSWTLRVMGSWPKQAQDHKTQGAVTGDAW